MLNHVAIVIGAALAAGPPAHAQVVTVGNAVGTLSITDQFGAAWNLAPTPGEVQVLVFAGERSLNAADDWTSAIEKNFDARVNVLRVLEPSDFPDMSHGDLKYALERRAPIGVDWDGQLGQEFGARKGGVTVALLDDQGVLRYVASGAPTLASYGALAAAVAAAMPPATALTTE